MRSDVVAHLRRLGEAPPRALVVTAFVLLALSTALPLAELLPPGQATDEGVHAIRVEALAHGIVVGHREGKNGGFTSPDALWRVTLSTPPGHAQTKAEREAAEGVAWSAPLQFHEIGTTAAYFPAVYAPAAAAVRLAQAAGATPFQAFHAARLMNAAVFTTLGALALWTTRRDRALIACVLLLPMSLGLAASLSGDAVMIGSAALAAACLTRAGPRPWAAAACAILLVGLTKAPYAPLLLLLLPAEAPRLVTRFGVVVLTASLCIGWAGFNQAAVTSTITREPYQAGPLWPGPPRSFDSIDPSAQLQVLQADPVRAVTLVTRTLAVETPLTEETIGVLGWLTIYMPPWVYEMWKIVFAVALLALPFEAGCGASCAATGVLAVVLALWGIMMAQYCGWTHVGADVIEGVQGRYFLTLLPFACLAIPTLVRAPVGLTTVLPLLAALADTAIAPAAVAIYSVMQL